MPSIRRETKLIPRSSDLRSPPCWVRRCNPPESVNGSPAKPIDLNITIWQYNRMAIEKTDQLSLIFGALADPTRRAILARLALGEADVSELMKPFDLSQPAISKHLNVLERAGLVTRGRAAQRRPRRLEARPLGEATQWLEKYRRYWEASFVRLEDLLSEMKVSERKGNRVTAKKR